MIEFLAIFVGGFIVLLSGVILYRFLFDKERWNKSLNDARAVGAAGKVKSEIKHKAMKERHDRIKAEGEMKLQNLKDRQAQKRADEKERTEEAQAAKVEKQERDRELNSLIAARKRAPQTVSSKAQGLNRRRKEDPLIGGIIGSLAAASLANDVRSALVNGEFFDDSDVNDENPEDHDDGAMDTNDGGVW